MKKTFGAYFVAWLAALGLFNLITFIVPESATVMGKYDTLFWICYVLITVAFLGNLGCAYYVFRSESQQKTFYNIPILQACNGTLVALLTVGVIFMGFVPVPTWIGVIICFAVLVFNIFTVAKAVVVADVVAKVDTQIKTQTFFIKVLTVDAQVLMGKTADAEMTALTRQVYEAVRYSDPMSNDALSNLEGRVSEKFSEFATAVQSGDLAAAQGQKAQLLSLLEERNLKCKMLK